MDRKDTARGVNSPPQGRADAAPGQEDSRHDQGTRRLSTHDGIVKDSRPSLPNRGNLAHTGAKQRERRSDDASKGRPQHWDTAKGIVDSCPEAREPQQRPAIERYLREGDQIEAYQRQEREGYPQGSPGMRQYLRDWQRTWDDTRNRK